MDDSPNSYASPDTPSLAKDWIVPILIAVLGGLEMVALTVLFLFETSLTPYVRRASATISGTVVLVGFILLVLCVGTAIFWAIFNQFKKRGEYLRGSDPNGTYLSTDAATATVCSLDVAKRNPGIGVMVERSPVFRCATYGLRVEAFMIQVP